MSWQKHASTSTSAAMQRSGPRHGITVQALFGRFADSVTQWTGTPTAFFLAVVILLIWALSGPWFHYSETWQLLVNTGTTIVTFLMVFVIQQSQNKDSHALHLKLDELLCANKTADNAMIDIEHLDSKDLDRIARRYVRLADERRANETGKKTRQKGSRDSARRLGRRRDRLAKGLAGFARQRESLATRRGGGNESPTK